jgi:hypothetical protein
MRKHTNILSWKGVERKMRYFWRGDQKRMTLRQKYQKKSRHQNHSENYLWQITYGLNALKT